MRFRPTENLRDIQKKAELSNLQALPRERETGGTVSNTCHWCENPNVYEQMHRVCWRHVQEYRAELEKRDAELAECQKIREMQYQAFSKWKKELYEDNARLRRALRTIADREHMGDKRDCTCYYGDNGYTCGIDIAGEALSQSAEAKAPEQLSLEAQVDIKKFHKGDKL